MRIIRGVFKTISWRALLETLLIQGLFDPQGGDWATISEEGMKTLLNGFEKR